MQWQNSGGEMKVEYVCHSGSDLLVVDAARASFGKQSEWAEIDGEKQRTRQMLEQLTEDSNKARKLMSYRQWLRDYESSKWGEGDVDPCVLKYEDYNLIHFLAREKHMLPFRHPSVTLRCRAPLFVARQLGKHQTGMSWSEESRRYITTEPEFFWPDKWRKRAENVKQGSSDEEFVGADEDNPITLAEEMLSWYNRMIEQGMAPEQARMMLPQNMMITWVWTGTLLAWNHMIKERKAPTTQRETQEFARMVEQIMNDLYPVSMEALRSY